MEKPEQLENPDLTKLRELTQDYVEYVDSPDYHEDNDYKHYIFEEVMETLFGKKYFDWENERTP